MEEERIYKLYRCLKELISTALPIGHTSADPYYKNGKFQVKGPLLMQVKEIVEQEEQKRGCQLSLFKLKGE